MALSTVPRAGDGGKVGGSADGEASRRDPAADCRAGCPSAQDLVPGKCGGSQNDYRFDVVQI